MGKKVLIISTSLRKNGNSDMLARSFAKGAEAAGNDVEIVSLADKQIAFCRGCFACQKTGKCIINDDAVQITEKIAEAEVLVKYKITVKNTGTIYGEANVCEYIPQGFEVSGINPKYWEEKDGKLVTKVMLDSGETKEKPSESAASSQDNPFKGTEWMCYDLSNMYNSVGIQIEKDKKHKGVMIYKGMDYILSESYTVTKNGDSYTASSKDFSITIDSKDARNGVITCSHFGLNNAPIAKR